MSSKGNSHGTGERITRLRITKTFAIAIAVGVGGHLAALALLRVEAEPIPLGGPKPGFVTIVSSKRTAGNLVVSEQLEYLNPEPLFLPTEWNAGEQPLPSELRRQPDQAFQSFEPQMTFSYNQLTPIISPPAVAFEEPIKALDLGGMPKFATVGRQERSPVSLDREAYLEVRRVGDGGMAHTGPLSGLPSLIKEVPWAPVNFLIAINEAGMLGSPTIEIGSGNTEIDDIFRAFLESKYRLGERLSPGFYRVTVGP